MMLALFLVALRTVRTTEGRQFVPLPSQFRVRETRYWADEFLMRFPLEGSRWTWLGS